MHFSKIPREVANDSKKSKFATKLQPKLFWGSAIAVAILSGIMTGKIQLSAFFCRQKIGFLGGLDC